MQPITRLLLLEGMRRKKEMKYYSHAYIYILIADSEIIYVGSTSKSLNRRLNSHNVELRANRSTFYKECRQKGIVNFTIKSLEYFQNILKKDLELREAELMKELYNFGHPIMNKRCLFNDREEVNKRRLAKLKRKREEKIKKWNISQIKPIARLLLLERMRKANIMRGRIF